MDSKSLMIGDWVYVPMAKHTARIDSILSKEEAGCDACIVVDFMGQGYLAHYKEKDITPIPLTAEILEKNGWKKHATYGTKEDDYIEVIYMLYQHSFEVVFNDNEAVSIRHFVSSDDDGYDKLLIEMSDNNYKPMYVHILQHALLQYGLNELADNFKI